MSVYYDIVYVNIVLVTHMKTACLCVHFWNIDLLSNIVTSLFYTVTSYDESTPTWMPLFC
jgi:hypothetical protein